MLTRARSSFASFILLTIAITACSKDKSPQYASADSAAAPTVAPPVVNITATEYAFTAPDTIQGGLTTLHLVDEGKELHHVMLMKLDSGKTPADFAKATKHMKPDSPFPSWVHPAGGVNAPRPGGGEASATLALDPGTYVMLCLIPDAKGVPHVMKGMVRPLTVVPATGPVPTEPKADVTMKLADYSFTLSTPITAGTHTIRVENDGGQPHEVQIVRLAPGKSAADMAVWVDRQYGPPPGEPTGGVPAIAVGAHAYITENFTPGNYALLCFLPDVKDGKPHAAHGMVKQISVS